MIVWIFKVIIFIILYQFVIMKILGIDPSIGHLGWGVIDTEKNLYLSGGTLYTNASESLPIRLSKLSDKIEENIEIYNPSVVALESVFLKKDLHVVFSLSYVRGMIMTIIGKRNIKMVEVASTKVKKNVAGSGRASKDQIKRMLPNLIKIPSGVKFSSYDETDAIAIAYCACLELSITAVYRNI